MPRYWIGVVSREHVQRGMAGGFAQVGHGKGAPLRRMRAGDWFFYYSPKESLDGDVPVRAFTAAGRVVTGDVYQVTMSDDFQPWRTDIAYELATEAPIAPMLERLSFTAGQKNWGFRFRTGHFEISAEDAALIAGEMNVELSS